MSEAMSNEGGPEPVQADGSPAQDEPGLNAEAGAEGSSQPSDGSEDATAADDFGSDAVVPTDRVSTDPADQEIGATHVDAPAQAAGGAEEENFEVPTTDKPVEMPVENPTPDVAYPVDVRLSSSISATPAPADDGDDFNSIEEAADNLVAAIEREGKLGSHEMSRAIDAVRRRL